jgi:ATP-binding cassette, subfamily B (MDR/TAP), member 1
MDYKPKINSEGGAIPPQPEAETTTENVAMTS